MEWTSGLANSTNGLKYGLTNGTNISLDYDAVIDTMLDDSVDLFSDPLNVVMVVLSIIALLGNALTIIATAHIPGRQTTHSKLIISLCIADICITVSVFLHVLVKEISKLERQHCLEVANRGFLCFALLASLINLLVMGIDHFVAVIRPLHYHLIMSPTRANIILIAIWIISALTGGFLDIIVTALQRKNDREDFCYQAIMDSFDAQLVVLSLVVLQMFVLIYLHCNIFHKIKTSTYMFQLNAQSLLRDSGSTHFHSRKAIITTVIIVGSFMITWVPYSIYHLTGTIVMKTCNNPESMYKYVNVFIKINNILWIMVQFNCIFNPLIYAVRTPAVRQGYKQLMNKLHICHSTDNDTQLSCSHKASARTYSSEMDIQLAQDIELNHIEMDSFSKKNGIHLDTKLTDINHCGHTVKINLHLSNNTPTNNNEYE